MEGGTARACWSTAPAEGELASLVAHARVYSPYFRELYSGLAFGPVTLTDLPVTHKPELMARFGEWVTDRQIRLDDLEAFAADPTLSGVRFLDEYFVCRSSGTTGHPGFCGGPCCDIRDICLLCLCRVQVVAPWPLASAGYQADASGACGRHGRSFRRSRHDRAGST